MPSYLQRYARCCEFRFDLQRLPRRRETVRIRGTSKRSTAGLRGQDNVTARNEGDGRDPGL